MGTALAHVFRGLPRRILFPSLFLMSDSSWAVTMEHQYSSNSHPKFAFFLGSGVTAYFSWCLSSISGYLIGRSIPNPGRFGLDFTMTAIFVHLIARTWRIQRDLLPWMVAATSSVFAARWLPGSWYILVGAILGSLTAAFSKPQRDL